MRNWISGNVGECSVLVFFYGPDNIDPVTLGKICKLVLIAIHISKYKWNNTLNIDPVEIELLIVEVRLIVCSEL